MRYDFDKRINRRGTYCFKWDGKDALKAAGITDHFNEDTLSLFTADLDMPCPRPIIDALHRVADQNIYGYTGCECGGNYFETVAAWFNRAYDWQVSPDEIVYFNGTNDAIETAVKALTKKGDGVIVSKPLYGPMVASVIKAGCKVINSSLKIHDDRYCMDFEDFEEKVKNPENKIFLLCNPHNPTGKVFEVEELQRIVDICRKNHVIIISDDVHADFVRIGKSYTPIAKVSGGDGIITMTAISKSFNCAGLIMTNVVIQDAVLREKFIHEAGFRMTTPFGIAAVIAAYTECDDWLQQINEYLDSNIEWVMNFLKQRMPKVKCIAPEGTYIIWMDFSGYQISHEEIRKRIYKQANVVLEDGISFDNENGTYFQRICVSTQLAVVKEAFTRIAQAFEDIND